MAQCNFAHTSSQKCSLIGQVFTLNDLENAVMKIPGKQMKLSWLILSRIGIHYLSGNFSMWTICQVHKKEFLDAWQVPNQCTHPDHISQVDQTPPTHLVNIVMSVKILQSESKVVPISSKFCSKCFKHYNDKYAGKPGEKLIVVVPKPKPIASSPFVPNPPAPISQEKRHTDVPMNINSRGVLASVEPLQPPQPPQPPTPPPIEEITIKTELVIENEYGNNNQSLTPREDLLPPPPPPPPQIVPIVQATPVLNNNKPSRTSKRKSQNTAKKDVGNPDEEDILDHDSDDDPTWGPKGDKDKANGNSESNIIDSFKPRKRKRIGPNDICVKKVVKPNPIPVPVKQKPEPKPKGRPPKKKLPSTSSRSSTDVTDSDSDADMLDVSEEKNRIEGAGGTDFHYYCKICQISFFKHTAFKHHVFNSLELHKQLKRKEKMKKEAEMEYECADCCIAFQDRKSLQAHMIEEHSDTSENPFFCQKCNVYLKVRNQYFSCFSFGNALHSDGT